MLPRLALLLLLPATLAPILRTVQGTRADYERAASLAERSRGKVRNERPAIHWVPGEPRLVHSEDLAEGGRAWWLVDTGTGERTALVGERAEAALARGTKGEPRIERVRPLGGARFELRVGDARWILDRANDALALAEAQATDSLSDDTSRSTSGGAPVRLEFRNARASRVELAWIDTQGRRQPYGAIEPGGRHAQNTFEGHNWLLLDEQGQPLGAVRASAEVDVVRIGADLVPLERGRKAPSAPRQERPLALVARGAELVARDASGTERVLATCPAGRRWEERFDWSPDGTRFVAWEHADGGDRVVHYVASSPKDSVHPELRSYPYLKPGDPIPQSWPRLFDALDPRELPVERALFANPWSIDRARWEPDSSRFTFVYNQRGHQVVRVVALDARTGEARTIVEEAPATFVDYAAKLWLHRVEGTAELLWMSERSGWNHLYRIDGATGTVLGPITQGEWVVKRVVSTDDQRRELVLQVAGRRAGEDPYHEHYLRVGYDGERLTELTQGDGTHELEFAPDGRTYLDRWSRVDLAQVTELRRTSDGSLVAELARGDTSALEATGWRPPERFVAKGRDGTTDIHGIVHWPSNFVPSRPHPVVEQIYAGPHDFHVPKEFRAHHGHASELAELGFVVVQIDGMGTNWRSKAFHDVAWKNLADSGFPDRIAWLRALAATHPGIDLSRVGIFGGSAGGQNALRALLDHGDFYRAAVADCGCHDNRVDKIWWNELWMSWPVGPHYEASSNVAHASRLRGDLLLIVGEADGNVDPASTLQVVDALIRADKDFDLLVIPGGGHGAGSSPYGWRRTMDFFVRKLLRVEPRSGG